MLPITPITPASQAGWEAETNSFRLLLKTTLFSFIAECLEDRRQR